MLDPREMQGNLLIKLGRNIFDQTVRGQGDFKQHLLELEKLLTKAHKLGYPLAIARILSNISTVYTYSGHLQESLRQDQAVIEYAREHQLPITMMVSALNNFAVDMEIQELYSEAVQAYENAISYARNHAGEQPVYQISAYSLAIGGKMSALLHARRYADIEPLYTYLESIAEGLITFSPSRYGEVMMMAFQVMAELRLHQGQVNEALNFCRRSLDFAGGYDLQDEIANIYHLMARIALTQKQTQQAEAFLQQADAVISQQPETVLIGLHFKAEYKNLLEYGFTEQAALFRQRAQDIFEKWNASECLELL